MVKTTRRYWLLGLCMLFGVAVMLVHNIHVTYMHPDEQLVYQFTRRDLSFLVWYLAQLDTHPPGWFSFFWVWRQFMGEGEFMGRVQAIYFSLIALTVVYQIGRRWFGSPRYGLFALVILSVTSLFFQYALEIRPYGLVLLLASLSMYNFQRWLGTYQFKWAGLYAVTMAAMLYVHYFLVMLVMAQVLYFLLIFPRTRRVWGQAFTAVALAGVLWLPWLPSAVGQVGHLRSEEIKGGNVRGAIGAGTTTEPTSPDTILKLTQIASNGQVALYSLVFALGLVYAWRKRNYRLALMWGIGVPTIAFVLNLVAAVYAPRYILNFIIGLALLLGVGLASLPSRIMWPALVGFAATSLWALPAQLPKDRIPYRDIFQWLSKTAQPGDMLFFDHAETTENMVKWHLVRYLRADLRAGTAWAADLAAAQRARRVWHITQDWTNPEVQANFKALERTHPRRDGIGRCDLQWCYIVQLMEAPS